MITREDNGNYTIEDGSSHPPYINDKQLSALREAASNMKKVANMKDGDDVVVYSTAGEGEYMDESNTVYAVKEDGKLCIAQEHNYGAQEASVNDVMLEATGLILTKMK